MRAILVLACAALIVVPAIAQDTDLSVSGGCAVVPILPAAVPVVEVRIGGKGPYRFAIDTGAEGHGGINAALARELGLPRVGQVETPGPDGTMVTGPVYGAPEISVGGVSFKNPDLVAMSDGPNVEWDGVLGNELLRLLPVTLDYGAARVRFGGPELTEGLPIGFDRGVPVLPVEIAGKRFKVHFDSGNAGAALFLDEAAARALPLAGEPAQRGSGVEAPLAVPVSAGSVRLPVQAVGWPSPRSGGNLGSRAMVGMAVTIDAASQLAHVAYSAAPPRCPR